MLALAVLPSASKAGVTLTTYDFYGLCDGCESSSGPETVPGANIGDGFFQEVTGTLTMLDYTPGTFLTDAHFVSFDYDGSNILSAFTVLNADLVNFLENWMLLAM